MIKITMYSQADSVAGQGVGSAYIELMGLLKDRFKDQFDIHVNQYGESDISHYHTINPTYFLSTFSKKRGRKIGYVHFLPETLEGSIKLPKAFRKIFYWYVIAFYRRMDELVVVNPSFIDKLVAYQIPRDRITYIPNFVDDQHFYPMNADDRLALRQKYHLKSNQFIVMGSGQIQERKGVFDFIQLAKDNPQVQFIWAGGFSFGRITDGYQKLKKVVDNPPANLWFPGIVSRSEINELLNLADLFLLPSYNELFPMSVLEAFSTGTAVMLRDLDLYHDIMDGYYLPSHDEKDMNLKLQQLIHDPTKLKELQQVALTASQRYSKDHLAGIWQDFYIDQAHKGGH